MGRVKLHLAGTRKANTRSKYLISIIKYFVSFSLVGALLWQFRSSIGDIPTFDLRALIVAIVLLSLQPILIGVRWLCLLRLHKSEITTLTAVGVTWFSVAANQVLPASVGGDAIRMFELVRRGENAEVAIGTVVLDRIFALITLISLIFIFSPFMVVDLPKWMMSLLFIGLVLIFFVLVSMRQCLRWISAHLQEGRYKTLLGRVYDSFEVMDHPRTALLVLLLCLVVHVLSLLSFLVLARGLGIELNALALLAVAALITFVQVVPISISGWGPREAAAIFILGSLGVAQETALALSILFGIGLLLVSLPGAIGLFILGSK